MIDPKRRYGFMRAVEADLLDELTLTLKAEKGGVRWLEIGVFGGGTATGIVKRCQAIDCPVSAAGVDFEQWLPKPPPLPDYQGYAGDSMDMWKQVRGTFNLLFVDGCHCCQHAQCDFLNYSGFVETGGYCLFHDTALPKDGVSQGDWPQFHGYAGTPDSTLGVRKALENLGLLHNKRTDWTLVKELTSDSGLMGMVLLKKLA